MGAEMAGAAVMEASLASFLASALTAASLTSADVGEEEVDLTGEEEEEEEEDAEVEVEVEEEVVST